jgi:hypothetical protein
MSARKQRSSGLSDLEYDIVKREYDEKYELLVPMSLVRLGFTDKELVKAREAVDLKQWTTAFVGTKNQCMAHIVRNLSTLLKMNTLYEYRG